MVEQKVLLSINVKKGTDIFTDKAYYLVLLS